MWSAIFKDFIKQLFFTGLFIAVLILVIRLLKVLSYTELIMFSVLAVISIIGLLFKRHNT